MKEISFSFETSFLAKIILIFFNKYFLFIDDFQSVKITNEFNIIG